MKVFLSLFCLAFLFSFVCAEEQPNVIVIVVDDQGYYDLGCYGATEVKTPRIDRMADEGVRFTDYYAAAPICSPSRAGLLTGCYPRRIGLETWVQRADSTIGINPDERTMAELFRENGYSTACIGKWHLGHQAPFLPRAQGFDHYFGLLHNLDPVETVYFEDLGGVPMMRNGEVVKRPALPEELTGAYTDEAIAIIEKNKGNPFFIYLPHTMLHNPLGVSEEFKGVSDWDEYGDAIAELDFSVGRIFDKLVELGIDQNTVVVYISDNGRGPGRNDEQPLQGRKLTTWEAGIRVPGIVWGPGVGVSSGKTESTVVSALDWFPTLATLAGIEVPRDSAIDGRDITPLISEDVEPINAAITSTRPWDPPGEWAPLVSDKEYQDAFFIHGSQGALAAVRWDKWKLYLNPALTLYNLEVDPGETRKVQNRDILRKLRGMVVMFEEEMSRDARPAGRDGGL